MINNNSKFHSHKASHKLNKNLNVNSLRRYFIFIFLLYTYYLSVLLINNEYLFEFTNWIGPLLLCFISIYTTYQFVKKNSVAIWTPLPWFLGATALYWGFGPLLYTFAGPNEILSAHSLYKINNITLLRTNILNTFGTMTVIATFITIQNRIHFNHIRRSFDKTIPIYKIKQIAILFLIVGGIIEYGFALPYEFGMANSILPGTVLGLSNLIILALLIFGYLSSLEGGKWKIIFVSLFIIELAVNILRFSKTALMLVIILGTLGVYFGNNKIKTLVIGLILCAITFYFYNNIVRTGRFEIIKMSGTHYSATLSERLNIFKKMLKKNKTINVKNKMGMWGRINYANVQAFAMDQYDAGYPGHDFNNIFWALIPRKIIPSKPIMTSAGLGFYTLLRKQQGSSLGITVFADAYYHGGWIMVVIVSIVIGLIFSLISRIASIVMSNKAIIFLPCIFYGIKMGYRIDGRFVADYVGSFVICVGYFVIIYYFLFNQRKTVF